MRKHPWLPLLSGTHAPLRDTLEVLQAREGLRRRRLLQSLGGVATLGLLSRNVAACVLIPAETAGPYPGDGSNGPNVLTQSGIVRADIRSSFGASGTATAPGTVLIQTLRLVSTIDACRPLVGLAVYAWHCNATGGYSMYSSGVTTQNYLRGVQISNANGEVTFTTIFPGCYPGRWPHIHFEIYASAAQAVSGANALRVSQLALPEAACREVYAQTSQTGLYSGSNNNLNGVTLASDNVFANDGGVNQLAACSGDLNNGYVASLEVGIAVAADRIFIDGFE